MIKACAKQVILNIHDKDQIVKIKIVFFFCRTVWQNRQSNQEYLNDKKFDFLKVHAWETFQWIFPQDNLLVSLQVLYLAAAIFSTRPFSYLDLHKS